MTTQQALVHRVEVQIKRWILEREAHQASTTITETEPTVFHAKLIQKEKQ